MYTSAAFGAAGEFAASHHGVITRSQAAAFGLTPQTIARLIERGVLRPDAPGVLVVVGAPATWHQRALVATAAHRSGAWISHRAAAALHRLDGCPPGAIEVVVPNGRRVRAPQVVVHQSRTLEAGDLTQVAGIACTGLARTLCDLGDVVRTERVLQALDDVQRRGTSLRWIEQTARRLDTPRRRGPRVLLDLLAERANGYRVPDSWFERLLEAALASVELAGMVRQHEIRTPGGVVVARVDLALPELRLGIEAHSRQFHFGRRAEARDQDRDLQAAKLGWEIIYLGFAATRQPAEVCADLVELVRRRRTDLAG